jgi:hypothetical protein
MLWSQAHGLATLFLDGPLEARMGSRLDAEKQVEEVIELAAHMVSLEAREQGLIPSQY